MKLDIQQELLGNVLSGIESTKGAESDGKNEAVFRLKDEHITVRCQDPAEVMMFASLIHEDDIEEYEPGDKTDLGLRLDSISSYINKTDETVSIETAKSDGGVDLLNVSKRKGSSITIPMIDTDSIVGQMHSAPSIEWPVEFIISETDRVNDFISRAKEVTGAGSCLVSTREEGFYLYAEREDYSTKEFIPWDDDDIELTKSDKDEVDTIFSLGYLSEVDIFDGDMEFHIGDEVPMKTVFSLGESSAASYILAPRVSNTEGRSKVPDAARVQ